MNLFKIFSISTFLILSFFGNKQVTADGETCGTTEVDYKNLSGHGCICVPEGNSSIENKEAARKNLSEVEGSAGSVCNEPCTGSCSNGCLCRGDPTTIKAEGSITNVDPHTRSCNPGKACGDEEKAFSYGWTFTGKISCTCKCQSDSADDDNDGTSNCKDSCPSDPNKTSPGRCGCNKPEDCDNLVNLKEFTAIPHQKGILLSWKTASEIDSQEFKMWRAIPKLSNYCGCSGNIDDYTQIQVLDKEGKPVSIPAKGGVTSGSSYSYLDENAKSGIAYCYALEDINSKGKSTFYFEHVAFTQDNLEEIK